MLSSLPIQQPWGSTSFTPTAGRIRPFAARETVRLVIYKTVIYNLVYLRAGEAELIYDIGSEHKFVSPFFREWIRRRN